MAPISTVRSVDHIVLTVKDLDATIKFCNMFIPTAVIIADVAR